MVVMYLISEDITPEIIELCKQTNTKLINIDELEEPEKSWQLKYYNWKPDK